jgi:3-oxo-5-alpha-steroid 4-dehydrogenase 1
MSFPAGLLIDAPFGRFTPSKESIFTVDGALLNLVTLFLAQTIAGIKSWIVMELVSPLSFLYFFLHSPLSPSRFSQSPPLSPSNPQNLLAVLFLTHYANRALISPLRTPSRSKSHLIVPLAAIGFNLVNGGLLGTYFSSPTAATFLSGAYSSPRFWSCVVLWAVGFAGNIVHDEILLNIRRNKQREAAKAGGGADGKQHYAIPHGLLFELVSFPNYFCEWMEWAAFALAAAPVPSLASPAAFMSSLTPPWLFFFAELLTMTPRALKGHSWYKRKFEDYPPKRTAVVPFVL